MKRRSFFALLGAALTPGTPVTAKPAAVTKAAATVAAPTGIEAFLAAEAARINKDIQTRLQKQ